MASVGPLELAVPGACYRAPAPIPRRGGAAV